MSIVRLMFFALLTALACVTACDDAKSPVTNDHDLRIVSLSPAISHVIIELGLGDSIVAVGDGDDIAALGTPSLGRYVDLDLERLVTLRPTHVLAMTGRAGLPTRVAELSEQGGFALTDLAYPDDVDAAVKLIGEVGAAVGRAGRGEAMAKTVRHQLDGIAAVTANATGSGVRPRVLIVFQTDPVMASGPGTVNDTLLHIAGGTNAAGEASVMAPTYDREGLLALAPEVIVVMSPGDPPLASMDDPRLGVLRGLDVPAVRDGRVVLLGDPAVLLPGPSMVTTAVSLAVALHPELDEAVAEVLRDKP